jgi:hypothetical protein
MVPLLASLNRLETESAVRAITRAERPHSRRISRINRTSAESPIVNEKGRHVLVAAS